MCQDFTLGAPLTWHLSTGRASDVLTPSAVSCHPTLPICSPCLHLPPVSVPVCLWPLYSILAKFKTDEDLVLAIYGISGKKMWEFSFFFFFFWMSVVPNGCRCVNRCKCSTSSGVCFLPQIWLSHCGAVIEFSMPLEKVGFPALREVINLGNTYHSVLRKIKICSFHRWFSVTCQFCTLLNNLVLKASMQLF